MSSTKSAIYLCGFLANSSVWIAAGMTMPFGGRAMFATVAGLVWLALAAWVFFTASKAGE